MAITSGNDYQDNVKGFGIGKAFKIIQNIQEKDDATKIVQEYKKLWIETLFLVNKQNPRLSQIERKGFVLKKLAIEKEKEKKEIPSSSSSITPIAGMFCINQSSLTFTNLAFSTGE